LKRLLLFLALMAVPVPYGRAQPAHAASDLQVSVADASIMPGHYQAVTVVGAPGTRLNVVTTFPNVQSINALGVVGASGRFRWRFRQPSSTITRRSRTAHVAAYVEGQTVRGPVASYLVRAAPIDIVVEPDTDLQAGQNVTLWVHAAARIPIDVTARTYGEPRRFIGRTGARGWARFSYTLVASPCTMRLQVHARTIDHRSASTQFRSYVAPRLSLHLAGVELWTRAGDGWRGTNVVHLNERTRLVARYWVTECAGNWVPPVAAPGTVHILKGAREVYAAPLDYAPPETGDGEYMYKDLLLSDPALVGTVGVAVAISWGGLHASESLQITVTP
jgi:hypothetical protein